MKGIKNMKNQNPVFIAIVFALAFALAPVTQAKPNPGGIPSPGSANEQPNPGGIPSPASAAASHNPGPEAVELPVITVHSTGDILRGKTGSFVLEMKPALMFGGMYVNFSVGGTAIPGVDYVAFVSPAYIGQSGYAVMSFATLPDPRAGSSHQAYSVVVKLEPGLGYAVGIPTSAQMWIK
jgi:hypothetical protein